MLSKFLLALCLFLGACVESEARIPLSGPADYYVEPGGVDTPTCTTAANPCATLQYPFSYVQQNYDLNGQTLTVHAAHGTYPVGILIYGGFVGQSTPWQVNLVGDAANPKAVVIQPLSSYCIGFGFNAMLQVSGIECDQSHNTSTYPLLGQDSFNGGWGGQLWFDHVVFGDNLNPFNDISTFGAGTVVVANGPYTISKTWKVTSGSWAAGSNFITLASCSDAIANVTPIAPGIPDRTIIMNCNPANGLTQINNYTTAAENNTSVGLSWGGNAHLSISTGSMFFDNTNCGNPPFTVTIENQPAYYQAFVTAFDGGIMNLGVTWGGSSIIHGYQYEADMNGVIRGCGLSVPGTSPGIVKRGGQEW